MSASQKQRWAELRAKGSAPPKLSEIVKVEPPAIPKAPLLVKLITGLADVLADTGAKRMVLTWDDGQTLTVNADGSVVLGKEA